MQCVKNVVGYIPNGVILQLCFTDSVFGARGDSICSATYDASP